MNTDACLLFATFIIGLVALIGFFISKTKGYGRFTTSTFLLLLVVTFTSLLYAAGKFDAHTIANIFFAVIGFAGGLFTAREKEGSTS